MIASFFALIGSWILGLIVAVIICVITYPICMIGCALNRGITKHNQINEAIKKAQREGHSIDWNRVNDYRKSANNDLQGGYVGMGIMVVIYLLIFIFAPQFFVTSLWGLVPFGIGLFGYYISLGK